jgi:hypothetical protein
MKKLIITMVILAGCSTEIPNQSICAKLIEQRARQVLNNHPWQSIQLTDQMLVKCGCSAVSVDTLQQWIRLTRSYVDSLQIARAKGR